MPARLSESCKGSETTVAYLNPRVVLMLLLVSSIKLVAEIALLALAGQFLLGLLAGAKRDSNFFYKLLQVLTNPFIKAMRLITPKAVLDRHLPLAAFVLLGMVWFITLVMKINICVQIGMEHCR